MRRVAPWSCLVVGCLALGCSTMGLSSSPHVGIAQPPPNAVVRTFSASATIVAERLVDVMREDPILENVVMFHDPANRECRSFSRADRHALKISPLTPANDVNFDVKAKCKDGSPVTIAVRLKGESSAEVSVLYGFGGDADLSRDLLDKAQALLDASRPKEEVVARTAGTSGSASR